MARVGGDEFLLMTLRPGHEAVAAAIAQRVLEALNEPLVLPNDVVVNLSASIGIVLYPRARPPRKMIANADAAMYAAKAPAAPPTRSSSRAWSSTRVSSWRCRTTCATRSSATSCSCTTSPRFHGKSGQITGVEALLRWQHPVRGFVSRPCSSPWPSASG